MSVYHDQEWLDARLAETPEQRLATNKAESAAWLEERHQGKYAQPYVQVVYLHNAVREIAWLCSVLEGAWATIDRLHERDRAARELREAMVMRRDDGTMWLQVAGWEE